MMTRATIEKWILPVALLIAWEAGSRAGTLPVYLSSPTAIAASIVELSRTGELPAATITSTIRAYAGFFVGAVLGVLLGLLAGSVVAVRNFLDPLIAFFYPIPKIAFLPIFLLLFGIGSGSQIAILATGVFFPVFASARHALVSMDKNFIWSAENMGAGHGTVFFRVLIPASAPELFSGLRIGLAHAFVLLFAAELMGARSGLGHLIVEGEEAVRFDMMFAGVVAFAVIGFISDRILMIIRRRMLRGQTIGTEEQVL